MVLNHCSLAPNIRETCPLLNINVPERFFTVLEYPIWCSWKNQPLKSPSGITPKSRFSTLIPKSAQMWCSHIYSNSVTVHSFSSLLLTVFISIRFTAWLYSTLFPPCFLILWPDSRHESPFCDASSVCANPFLLCLHSDHISEHHASSFEWLQTFPGVLGHSPKKQSLIAACVFGQTEDSTVCSELQTKRTSGA